MDFLLLLQVVDKLMGIGPMRDMAIGDPISSAPGSHDRRGPPHLVACSDQGKHGALTVLRRNLVPELIVQVPQGTCHTSSCQAGCKVYAEWQERLCCLLLIRLAS